MSVAHPFRRFNLLSPRNQERAIQQQKALLYVAMSRARDLLTLIGTGNKSE